MPQNSLKSFSRRHIGINDGEYAEMLATIGDESLNDLLEEAVPSSIRMNRQAKI